MSCEIKWTDLNDTEWNEKLKDIPHSTITQGAAYGKANCVVEKIKMRRGFIIIDGKEKGLLQIFEASLFFQLIHGVIIDRGPLWFEGHGGANDIKVMFDALNKEFPARFGRKRRFLPEIEHSPTAHAIIKQCGWVHKNDAQAYKTLWLDFTTLEEESKDALHKGWKGSLKKAEQSAIEIQWDCQGISYPFFKKQYLLDKVNKAYYGLSPQLLDNLALFSTKAAPMIIGNATSDGEIIASVLFFVHGRSATYQIGWTSPQGRDLCAHHLLLWRSRDILNTYGVQNLDLGGLNDQNEGLSRFKKGTGARAVTLVGHYT